MIQFNILQIITRETCLGLHSSTHTHAITIDGWLGMAHTLNCFTHIYFLCFIVSGWYMNPPAAPPVYEKFTFMKSFEQKSKRRNHAPSILFLLGWAPPRQGKPETRPPWSSSPPSLVTSRSATPLDSRSRALMFPSKLGKTAEPGCRESQNETHTHTKPDILTSHLILYLVFRSCFSLSEWKNDNGVW